MTEDEFRRGGPADRLVPRPAESAAERHAPRAGPGKDAGLLEAHAKRVAAVADALAAFCDRSADLCRRLGLEAQAGGLEPEPQQPGALGLLGAGIGRGETLCGRLLSNLSELERL